MTAEPRRRELSSLIALPRSIAAKIKRRLMPIKPPWQLIEYRLPSSTREEVQKEYQGPLAEIFFGPKSRLVDKWLHYLPIYERYFSCYRGKELKFLEIGVFRGGSLEMWRSYFGERAEIVGVDIDPACARYETAGTRVRIGSQDDPAFLTGVVNEVGAPDIVLDDGSHIAKHQEMSFQTLFPLLKEGGLYIIEDMHTAYWRQFGGGYRRKGSAIELVKDMIDDMHGWYHERSKGTPGKTEIGAIHVYDSLVVIEKARRERPSYIRIPATNPEPALAEAQNAE